MEQQECVGKYYEFIPFYNFVYFTYQDSRIFDENIFVVKYSHNYLKNLNYTEQQEFIQNQLKLFANEMKTNFKTIALQII